MAEDKNPIDPSTRLHQTMAGFRNKIDALISGMLQPQIDHATRAAFVEMVSEVDKLYDGALAVYNDHITLGTNYLQVSNRAAELEKKTAHYKAYRPHEPSPGVLVYAKRQHISPPDPSQWLCCDCDENGVTAPLQRDGVVWRCPYCSFRLE